MATMDGVVKEAIKTEIEAAVAALKESLNERFAGLEQKLEALSGGLEAATKGMEETVAKQRTEAQADAAKDKADVEALCESLKTQLQRFESDEEGPGGIRQLRDRVEEMGTELKGFDAKLQEQVKATKTLKGRADGLDDRAAQLGRQAETLSTASQKAAESIQQLQASGTVMEERLREVEDSWGRKHEALWQDVHRAVEEVRSDHRQGLQEDMERRTQEMKQHAKSHANYVTQMLASAHQQRRADGTRKGFFQVWREQVWLDRSKRAGYVLAAKALHAMGERRERRAMERWRHTAAVESLAERLKGEYEAKLPEFQKIVDDSTMMLKSRCEDLAGHLDGVRQDLEEKCSKTSLSEALASQTQLLEAQATDLSGLKEHFQGTKEEIAQASASVEQKFGEQREALAAQRSELDAALSELSGRCAGVAERLEQCAGSEALQHLMKDVLLIWNSLKQLDAGKADKATMDAFAMEIAASCEQSARGMEEMQTLRKGGQEDATLACQDLQARLDATTSHWQAMWDKLAGLMEETVAKVADLQAPASRPLSARRRTSSPPPPSEPVATVRPHDLTRPPSGTARRSPAPTMRGGYASSSASTASTAAAASPMVGAGQLILSGSSTSIQGAHQATLDEVNSRVPLSPSFPPSEVKVGRLRPSSATRRPPASR